ARAVLELDHTFVLELAIRLGDRVRVDHELFRERPDARQLVAGPEGAGLDRVLHLLHELEVNRHAQGRIRLEDHAVHSTTVIALCLLCYSCSTVVKRRRGAARLLSRRNLWGSLCRSEQELGRRCGSPWSRWAHLFTSPAPQRRTSRTRRGAN